MAKGVKKIKKEASSILDNLTAGNSFTSIPADEWAYFVVSEWLPDTTAEDKKKDITWMRQSADRKTILNQLTVPSNKKYALMISKKLSGSFSYYIEASLSGKRSFPITGIFVRGHCQQKVLSSKWSTKPGGPNIKNQKDIIKYGHVVYLHLETEGLNGNKLIVELYNRVSFFKDDPILKVYTNVQCINGEVNLELQDTFSWMGKINNLQDNEQFYIRLKDASTGQYVVDEKNQTPHAVYLNIKNEVVTTNVNVPKNNQPATVAVKKVSSERYEPCKFNQIVLSETKKDKGKADTKSVTLFEDGKTKLANPKSVSESVSRSVYFNFDKSDIRPDAKEVMSNVLLFLLEHQGSVIHLDAHADDRGTDEYNMALSQRRADVIKKFLVDGGLDGRRIIPVGHGESQLKIKGNHLTEAEHQINRRTDISFTFDGHLANSMIYQTIGPSPSTGMDLIMVIPGFDTKKCFIKKHIPKKVILKDIGQELDKGDKQRDYPVDDSNTVKIKVHSDLSRYNPAPLQYLWPRKTTPNQYWYYINTCRYYTEPSHPTVIVQVFPDIKWTLEFQWNHTEAFAYTFGKDLHPHDLVEARKKAIGSVLDGAMARGTDGEMSQSFKLSFSAEWDEKQGKAEIGDKFGERIAKTLRIIYKVKTLVDQVSNSPLAKGKFQFEVKAPVLAVSAQWYLERAAPTSPELATIVVIGVSAKPLIEADFSIDLITLFIESAGNAVCPGAGTVINWVRKNLSRSAEIKFVVDFKGGIYVDGKVTYNTVFPKETKGELKTTGKIEVSVEFSAKAEAGYSYMGVEGVLKAAVLTSVTGGIKFGADKKGIYATPVAEFEGIKATFVAAVTVKYGIFKRTFSYDGEAILVEPIIGKFSDSYLDL